jgi:hypothetical protein
MSYLALFRDQAHVIMTERIYDCLIKFCLWQQDPKIAEYYEGGLGQVNEGFRCAIINGQKAGDISADKDPKLLADFLTGFFYGLQVMGNGNISKHHHNLKRVISNALIDMK